MPFAQLSALPARTLLPGITGRYAHTARLTTGEVELAAGAVLPVHQHPHDQLSYVLTGEIEFTIGSETRVMTAGTCALIAGGTPHGCRVLTAARVLDTFTPVREDYR